MTLTTKTHNLLLRALNAYYATLEPGHPDRELATKAIYELQDIAMGQ